MHVLIDESKASGYILAVVSVRPDQLEEVRSAVRGWVWPGQARVHAKSESNPRRRALFTAMATLDVAATLYLVGGGQHERLARSACLATALGDLAVHAYVRVTVEWDEQAVLTDRRVLRDAERRLPAGHRLEHHHLRAAQEPMLAIPDLLAWGWQRGGEFRRRASALATVRHL